MIRLSSSLYSPLLVLHFLSQVILCRLVPLVTSRDYPYNFDMKQPSGANLYAAPGTAADDNVPNTAERDGAFVPDTDEFGYRILEQPLGTKRRLRVVLMGAGASTLNFLKKAEEEMQDVDITVYEKNHDIGGTWLENRYPGCACDSKCFHTIHCSRPKS